MQRQGGRRALSFPFWLPRCVSHCHHNRRAGTLAGKGKSAMRHALRPFAAIALSTLACTAYAGDDPSIIITASRFPGLADTVPADVTVITRDQIGNTPATNLPDLLKAAAGVDVRPLYGAMGIDAAVDLRGFGDTSSSNTLVLVDGQRLNPIDSAGISWSTVPLASIDRIEIVRGAGAVLYGDQASGGVINIITDTSGGGAAFVEPQVGSFGYRGADAGLSGNAQGDYYRLAAHYAQADGWRINSQSDQQSLNGRVGSRRADAEVFADFTLYKDASGLPGALLTPDYQADPRRARTPFDSQSRDGFRLRPGMSLRLSSSLTVEAEVGMERENYGSDDVSYASVFARQRTMLSATPRLLWTGAIGALASETVAGLDIYDGRVGVSVFGSSFIPERASQVSAAAYVQNRIALAPRWSLTTGLRIQDVNQHASEGAYAVDYGAGPVTVPAFDGSTVRTRSAIDAGLVYQGVGWRAFAKAGTVFRFANTDELFGQDPFTGNPVFAGDLRPQHGRIVQVGASTSGAWGSAHATAYRLDMSDEIGFDGATFANVNLAATRRQGLEGELSWHVVPALDLRAAQTLTDAAFREGTYAGDNLPLVAREKTSLLAVFDARQAGTYSAGLTHLGGRPYSGDFANALGTLAGYTTADLQARWRFSRWTLTARVINALDRRYAAYGGYSSYLADHYYYPADARSVFVALRYDVR